MLSKTADLGPFVRGAPRWILRLEGASALAAAGVIYGRLGIGWPWFFALFLLPDLSMLGYLAGPRIGALTYNAAHSYVGPIALGSIAFVMKADPIAVTVAVVWIAHIGFDRALGYGLKYGSAFGDTHLGRVGRKAS